MSFGENAARAFLGEVMIDDFRQKTYLIEDLLKAVDAGDSLWIDKALTSWRDQGKPLPEDCWLFRKSTAKEAAIEST